MLWARSRIARRFSSAKSSSTSRPIAVSFTETFESTPSRRDRVEHFEVNVALAHGGLALENVLAEKIERRRHASFVERGGRPRIGGVDRLAGDEPPREKIEVLLNDKARALLYDAAPQNPGRREHDGREYDESVAERERFAHARGGERDVKRDRSDVGWNATMLVAPYSPTARSHAKAIPAPMLPAAAGSAMREKIRHSLAPSVRAASA